MFDFEASTTEVKAGDVVDVTLNVTGAEDAQTVGWQFELDLPEGLEYIGSDALSYNQEMGYLYIPASVTYIDDAAFDKSNSGLTFHVEAGSAAAHSLGEVVATHVIPRPHADVEKLLPKIG